MISSYPKVHNLGSKWIENLLEGTVIVQEKIDGSQFSFMLDEAGQMHFRSKGQEIIPDAPEKMFAAGVKSIMELQNILPVGLVFRGEYLSKPKHNVLAYDRAPNRNVIIFDIQRGEDYLSYEEVQKEAHFLGLEVVPRFELTNLTMEGFKELLQKTSVLGGQKIEGVVFKNYGKFTPDGKAMMGKYVSEAFKEIHGGEWKKANPSKGDIIDQLIASVRTPARWNKAVQHLKEAGRLENSPKDIGNLMKEVQKDLMAEEEEALKEAVWKWAKDKVLRGAISGLPQWYKDELAKQQFGETE